MYDLLGHRIGNKNCAKLKDKTYFPMDSANNQLVEAIAGALLQSKFQIQIGCLYNNNKYWLLNRNVISVQLD